jgi:hypothetical protein
MCEAFTLETKEYCGQLHQIFQRSLNHVHKTLDVLMHYSLDHKVLEVLEDGCSTVSTPGDEAVKA